MTIKKDDAEVWTFCYVPHINGAVIGKGGGGVIDCKKNNLTAKFAVRGSKKIKGINYNVLACGQTDLEAMHNAIVQAFETEKEINPDPTPPDVPKTFNELTETEKDQRIKRGTKWVSGLMLQAIKSNDR
jgi:hypothetical protein